MKHYVLVTPMAVKTEASVGPWRIEVGMAMTSKHVLRLSMTETMTVCGGSDVENHLAGGDNAEYSVVGGKAKEVKRTPSFEVWRATASGPMCVAPGTSAMASHWVRRSSLVMQGSCTWVGPNGGRQQGVKDLFSCNLA